MNIAGNSIVIDCSKYKKTPSGTISEVIYNSKKKVDEVIVINVDKVLGNSSLFHFLKKVKSWECLGASVQISPRFFLKWLSLKLKVYRLI
jgi:hypothetical protein